MSNTKLSAERAHQLTELEEASNARVGLTQQLHESRRDLSALTSELQNKSTALDLAEWVLVPHKKTQEP